MTDHVGRIATLLRFTMSLVDDARAALHAIPFHQSC